jgi:histone-lysine N-methyltransferase SETD2
MHLNSEQTIDATEKGTISRFINHCCAPNVETQKWVIAGIEHIGLFAVKHIKAQTELTYDYFGGTTVESNAGLFFGSIKQKCYCGEPCCGGFLGAPRKAGVAVAVAVAEAEAGNRNGSGAKKRKHFEEVGGV